jgi:hypothetical protein
MDSRDTKSFYAKRQAGNPSFEPYANTGFLLGLCVLLGSTGVGLIAYKIITELYL